MECIVIGERVYRVKHKSLEYIKTVILDWYSLTDKIVRDNGDNYIRSYREALGVPLGATIDEEASYVHETYGEKPYKSEEFVGKLDLIKLYNQEYLPDFVTWLNEREIEVSIETNVFVIDEEVDYG